MNPKKFLLYSSLAAFLWSASNAGARQSYLSLVPNTNSQSCLPCHSNGGGSARTNFGLDFQNQGFSWSHLWNLDSDNDGQTNGEELGDPCGTWVTGAAIPRAGYISAPEDDTSFSEFPTMGASVWYFDGDHDGVGVGSDFVVQCAAPIGDYVAVQGDCDDDDATVWQEADAYVDADLDGIGSGVAVVVCRGESLVSGLSDVGSDCDDDDENIYQYLSGFDDADEDGFGGGSLKWFCSGETVPSFVSLEKTDCDDTNSFLAPWRYLSEDADQDGFPATWPQRICSTIAAPEGQWEAVFCGDSGECASGLMCDTSENLCVPENLDCDDTNTNRYVTREVYADVDGDGYGAGELLLECVSDPLLQGWSDVGHDCDDTTDTGIDIFQAKTVYLDADGDGFTKGGSFTACVGNQLPSAYVLERNGEDCDDQNHLIYQELFGFPDLDQDGLSGVGQSVCTDENLPNNWSSIKYGSDCDDNNGAVPQFLCEDRPDLCGLIENGCPAPGTYCGPCPTSADAGSALYGEDAGWPRETDAGERTEHEANQTDAGYEDEDLQNEPEPNNDPESEANAKDKTLPEEGGCLGQQLPRRGVLPAWLWGLLLMTWSLKRKRGPQS